MKEILGRAYLVQIMLESHEKSEGDYRGATKNNVVKALISFRINKENGGRKSPSFFNGSIPTSIKKALKTQGFFFQNIQSLERGLTTETRTLFLCPMPSRGI